MRQVRSFSRSFSQSSPQRSGIFSGCHQKKNKLKVKPVACCSGTQVHGGHIPFRVVCFFNHLLGATLKKFASISVCLLLIDWLRHLFWQAKN